LFPPVVIPPLLSLTAPVVTVTFAAAFDVGVPDTVHEIEAPAASEAAGEAGVHVPSVTPAGRFETAHVALSAAAVDVALFVHLIVPVYGTPTVIDVGRPDRSGNMSEATVAIAFVVVSFAVFASFTAVDVTEAVVEPGAVGIPDTGHEIDAPMASEATGKAGVHVPTVTPGGRFEIAHVGLLAAAVAAAAFVHTTVPE
jgi:hypothetical protein